MLKVGFSERRRQAAERLPEFEALRDRARDIKNHALANLDFYLEEFERKAKTDAPYSGASLFAVSSSAAIVSPEVKERWIEALLRAGYRFPPILSDADAKKAWAAAAGVASDWAPRLAVCVAKADADCTVSVVPSMLPSTLSEVDPADSRLRPLKLAF